MGKGGAAPLAGCASHAARLSWAAGARCVYSRRSRLPPRPPSSHRRATPRGRAHAPFARTPHAGLPARFIVALPR